MPSSTIDDGQMCICGLQLGARDDGAIQISNYDQLWRFSRIEQQGRRVVQAGIYHVVLGSLCLDQTTAFVGLDEMVECYLDEDDSRIEYE